SGPGQARNSLRQLLLVLRRELGRDIIRAERDPLSMDIGSVAVDAVAFEDDAGAADLDRLARSARLYRGELLEDIGSVSPGFDEWLQQERGRLAGLASEILRR